MAFFGRQKKNNLDIFKEDVKDSEVKAEVTSDDEEISLENEVNIPKIKQPMKYRQFSTERSLSEEFNRFSMPKTSDSTDETDIIDEETPQYTADSFESTVSFEDDSPSEEETTKEDTLYSATPKLYEDPKDEEELTFGTPEYFEQFSTITNISEDEGTDDYKYEHPDSFDSDSSLVSFSDDETYSNDDTDDSMDRSSAFVNLYDEENDNNISDDDFNSSDSYGDTSSLVSLEDENVAEETMDKVESTEEIETGDFDSFEPSFEALASYETDDSVVEVETENLSSIELNVEKSSESFVVEEDETPMFDLDLDKTKTDDNTILEEEEENIVNDDVSYVQEDEQEQLIVNTYKETPSTYEDVSEVTEEEPYLNEDVTNMNIGLNETDDYVFTITEDNTCILHKVKNPTMNLEIPTLINGYKVVAIESNDNKGICNSRESKVVSVIVPEGIEKIGRCSFYGCKDLEVVELPNTLTIIDEYAFAYCLALRSISIPNSVVEIKQDSFKCCTNLTFISIYNENCNIDGNVFDTRNKNTTIYGFKGSQIENYAKQYNKNFRELVITKISVTYTGSSLNINEEINRDDVIVHAIWSNKQKEQIDDFSLATSSFTDSGQHRVNISYVNANGKRFDTSFEIFVKGKILEDITATYVGEAVIRGTELNSDDIQVFGMFDDDSIEEIKDFIVDDKNIEYIGDNIVTVIYDSRLAEVIVPGIRETVINLDITFNREDFRLNEILTKDDFSVIATYSNGKIVEDIEFELSQYEFETEGINSVTITVEDFSKSIEIEVLPYEKITMVDFLAMLQNKTTTYSNIDTNSTIDLDKINMAIQRKSDSEFVVTFEQDGRHSILVQTN